MSERCGYCTVSPENAEDYCDAHRPNWSAPPPPEPLNAEARRAVENAECATQLQLTEPDRELFVSNVRAALLRVQAEARREAQELLARCARCDGWALNDPEGRCYCLHPVLPERARASQR
jgi:hypothetical protein